ncbi:MAG TPA: tetratricopeptide repeat protein, partial [Flavisolibacter sp.]|nr:tetratricopeptide repeat protein [Flavisolibacter sp.]
MKQQIKFFLFCQLLFVSLFASAQTDELQQLKKLKDDTAKVNKLAAYGRTLLDVDNAQAVRIYEDCIALSDRLGYEDGKALSLRRIGYVHGQEGRYQQAINFYHSAIALYKKAGSVKDLLTCYNNLGANLRQLGKVDSTIHYYFMAIQLYEKHALDKETEATRKDMVNTYALLHENISTLYGNMENISKALEYGYKAIRIAEETKDSVRLTLAMISTSNAYYVNKNFAQSLAMARKAAAIADVLESPIPQSKAYHLLSVSYTGLGQPDSGIYAANKSMVYAKNSDLQLYLTSLMDLADAYHDKKDFAKEAAALKEAMHHFEQMDNVAFGMNIYEKLAKASYALGKYKEAYDYQEKSVVYNDSMMSKENRDVLARLEMEYQTAKREKALSQTQLQLAQKELQLQKNRHQVY